METQKVEKGGNGTIEINRVVNIPAPNIVTAKYELVGTAPFVQNKFGAKAKQQIMDTQKAGSVAKSKKNREPKDFDQLYHDAMHISMEGWNGIPAPAFRAAMIAACRLTNMKMTFAKQAVFIVADGFDKDDGTPLVKISTGKPEKHISPVRNETGVVDIRSRPMWREWGVDLQVKFDADVFSHHDVTNLLMRAGLQVGIGEGRPASKKSNGMGWGTFEIKESQDAS